MINKGVLCFKRKDKVASRSIGVKYTVKTVISYASITMHI